MPACLQGVSSLYIPAGGCNICLRRRAFVQVFLLPLPALSTRGENSELVDEIAGAMRRHRSWHASSNGGLTLCIRRQSGGCGTGRGSSATP